HFSPSLPLADNSVYAFFHDLDLRRRQPVQIIHQPVDLRVRRGNLTLEDGLLRGGVGSGKLLVKGEHGGDEVYHAVVRPLFSYIGKVNNANRQLTEILLRAGNPAPAKNIAQRTQTP